MRTVMVSFIITAGLGALMALPLGAQEVSPQEAAADFDPASIMPADTKVYLELGSPGRQFETILKLFEGTPLEESLAALLSQNQGGDGGGGPAHIMQAIMNPAMMKEFKKIQGAAIGITGFNEGKPEFVVVLSPGQSDALRGVLVAGVSIAGVAGQSIDGMQSLTIKDAGVVAYDNSIFVMANSPEKLKETLGRYKDHTKNTSLAQTALFQKLDRNKRAANAVTMWANGKKAWHQVTDMMAKSGDKEELAVFNMVADPNHIEDVLLQLSVLDNDIVLDATLSLDENHQCQGYNMIRTPNLSSKGMASVPSDTIGMISFALGDADSAGSQKIQGAVKQMTGLDVGRELFSNIEQVNVFVVEPQDVTDVKDLPVTSIGISITSKDGQKTKNVLNTLFQTAYQAMKTSGEFKDMPTQLQEGQYIVPVDNKIISLYLEQKGNVTVLSPSRQIINTCFKASADSKNSVLAGLLKPVLGTMSPTTSKMIVVNAGGLLRLADAIAMLENKNPYNPAHQQVKDFSRMLDTMNICIRTSETPTRFNFNASINDVPPLGPLFPKAAALAKCDFNARGCATDPVPCNHGSITPGQPYKLEWKQGFVSKTHKVYFGTKPSELKLIKEIADATRIEGPSLNNGTENWYWRVDEVLADGAVIPGDVWDFGKTTLIGYWKLDESSESTANDASGHNHNGSVKGDAAWQPSQGIHGGAIELDGTDNAIEINDFSFATNTATFTAWIKGQKAADWSGILFSRGWQPCGMHFGVNNTLHYTWNNNDSSTYEWNDGPVIPENTWAFVAIVIQPDKTVAYVYDQNNGLKSAENPVPNIPQQVDNLKIGWDTEQEARRFKGLVDDVRVYNYALSQDEIKALTQKEAAPTPVASAAK